MIFRSHFTQKRKYLRFIRFISPAFLVPAEVSVIEAVQQPKNSGKRKANRALNPKRSVIFTVKINCGTASIVLRKGFLYKG